MKYILCVGLMLCFGMDNLTAQIQFANIHQIPLVLTPSNVGSKNGHRLVLAANNNAKGDAYTNSNYAINFDTFSKKHRLAMGGYYFQTKYERSLPISDPSMYKDRFAHQIFNTALPNQETAKEGGLCMGIKYNVLNKNNPNTFKASITPALGISMGTRSMNSHVDFGYVSTNNTYLDREDSIYYSHQISSTFFGTLQLGIKYNSERLLLMYHTKFRKEWVAEKHIAWSSGSGNIVFPNETLKEETESQLVNNSLENRVTAAYVAYKSKSDHLGLTLYGSLGLLSPIAIPKSRRGTFTENSYLIYRQKEFKNQYLASIAALAKVYKTLWGVSGSVYGQHSTYGITAGLQFKYFKLLGTYLPKTSSNRLSTLEAVLLVYIPE